MQAPLVKSFGIEKQSKKRASAGVRLYHRLLTEGTDLFTVSKMLGHTNIKTTQIYAKVVDSKKEQAADAIQLILHSDVTG